MADLSHLEFVQNLVTSLGEMTEPDPGREGTSDGSFVVVAETT